MRSANLPLAAVAPCPPQAGEPSRSRSGRQSHFPRNCPRDGHASQGLFAHFCASSRLTGEAGAEPSQGGQEEKQRGQEASARLGALGPAPRCRLPGWRGWVWADKKKRSGSRPRSSGRGLALHFTLDQTPAEGRAEAQNRRREERRARAAMVGRAAGAGRAGARV